MITLALEKVSPRSCGSKRPWRPAIMAERRMYVTKAMVGMYMSAHTLQRRLQWGDTCLEHTGRVDILSRRQELCCLPIRPHSRMLSAPRPVPPREQHNVQFLDNVAVGDVEVVFQGGNIDVAVDL